MLGLRQRDDRAHEEGVGAAWESTTAPAKQKPALWAGSDYSFLA